MLAVDTVAFFIVLALDHIYLKTHPQDAPFFDGVDLEKFKHLSIEQKLQIFDSMCSYPKRRALYTMMASVFKVIPGTLVIIFVWEHVISNFAQLGILLGIYLVLFVYFYGAVYIESHIFLSRLMKELHSKLNLKEVFEKTILKNNFSEFKFQENLILVLLVMMTCLLQAIVVLNHADWSPSEHAFGVVLVGILGMGLFARIWYLGRSFLFGGFEELFEALNNISYEKSEKSLALHTDSLLARFEMNFNNLVERLRQSEHAMSSWVVHESHKSRYRALGEMSSLIAHDLTAPLHVIKFCMNSIRENPDLINNSKYIENISLNVERANELVVAMRARVKDPDNNQLVSDFSSTHKQVLRLLETQFHAKDFRDIDFQVDPALDEISFRLSRSDLIHILENIYRNAVTNLVQNKISHPQIQVHLMSLDSAMHYRLAISDNGTGLSKLIYDDLTAYSYRKPKPQTNSTRSMGLMLTRRLIEMNDGIMELKEHSLAKGTCFELDLPKSPL